MAHRTSIAALLIALFGWPAAGCDEDTPRALAPSASAAAPKEDAPLAFSIEGQTIRTLTRADLEEVVAPETLTIHDPYYGRKKTFRALRLRDVLAAGFAGRGLELTSQHYVLRARDGYTVPISGERLLEDGGYLAVADLEVAGWEPIGQQRANPGPYYLVWKNPGQEDVEAHPRPWQLAGIEVASFERVFPHVAPAGLSPDSPAQRGYAIFREQCIRCHAINQEGGQVGPELNVPQNILAYRPEDQVRAYIRNPQTFRYSKMPAFTALSDRDLDDLVAYLRAMGERQHDPKAEGKR